jgi:hypothetical protein
VSRAVLPLVAANKDGSSRQGPGWTYQHWISRSTVTRRRSRLGGPASQPEGGACRLAICFRIRTRRFRTRGVRDHCGHRHLIGTAFGNGEYTVSRSTANESAWKSRTRGRGSQSPTGSQTNSHLSSAHHYQCDVPAVRHRRHRGIEPSSCCTIPNLQVDSAFSCRFVDLDDVLALPLTCCSSKVSVI